ncbi:cysteine hydrolase family protein [Nesterenkonia aerolata]|uniref:Cysteine hydrolase family protein n=1 Tax=Nesterenkonia aerolata TaxID=3074079 RepID=A0ABU2DTC5_9MICC|nr:cysteine hydrolase family protein [Nesterenkonia sp. LY-0111]MDR8019756.1 cysteine hydrolase family protein [Nesterenkonia sp. LY-0111]
MTQPKLTLRDETALVVVDVQKGFHDGAYWGPRNNPECEENIAALLDHWRSTGRPVMFVRHDSFDPRSPLHPDAEGNIFQDMITGEPELLVTKNVNSSFHGSPDLDAWLQGGGITQLVICGITTNHCCETTARVGGNLGYDVYFALDATHTFDRRTPEGDLVSAETLAQITATNLHGEFATVTTTQEIVNA